MELQTIKRPARAVFHSPFQQKLSPLTLGMALLYLGERFKLIQSLFPLTVIIFSASYILWRLWTFTISPALRPKEPKLVPYLVPGWGHASWLLRDQIGLFKYGSAYTGTHPFAVYAAGRTIYVMSNISDISAMYKSGPSISFEESNRYFFTQQQGMSKAADELMYAEGHQGSYPNPHSKSVGALLHDVMRANLEAPAELDNLVNVFQTHLERQLRTIPKQCIVGSSEDWTDVSLLKLCQRIVISAGLDTFYGLKLQDLCEENFIQTFVTFDDNVGKMLQGLPPFMAREFYRCRKLLLDTVKRYHDTPQEQRGQYSNLAKQFEEELRTAGVVDNDLAINVLVTNWVFNVNAFKVAFWILSWITADATLHSSILTEIDNVRKSNYPAVTDLLNSCPTLNAAFDETQRLTMAALSSRVVTKDTDINGWTYRAGGALLVSYRTLHFQKAVFGEDINEFDHTRFLHKTLNRDKNFKPFGGGSTLCTGRFLARREVLLFVAMLLTDWSVTRQSTSMPELELFKPSLGTVSPKEGHEVIVRLRRRQHHSKVDQ